MIDHPVALFLFVLWNVFAAFGMFTIAFGIMKRADATRFVKVTGMLYLVGNGCYCCALAWLALWYPGFTLGNVAGSRATIGFLGITAFCVWLFLIGVFLQLGRVGEMPTMEGLDGYDSRHDDWYEPPPVDPAERTDEVSPGSPQGSD